MRSAAEARVPGAQWINPSYTGTLWRCGDSTQCCDARTCDRAECVAQGLGETYKRIAALEYPASADRVAYQYFGSQVGARPLKNFHAALCTSFAIGPIHTGQKIKQRSVQ